MTLRRHPRPAILDELSPDRHALIEASAGTGKTFTIEHLVIELLLETGVPIEDILVITFTDRAATELRCRIRRKIQDILRTGDGDPGPGVGSSWSIGPAQQRILRQALTGFDGASIHTIHGFFQRVLGAEAFRIGRLFSEELVSGRQAFRGVFRRVLRSHLAVDPAGRSWLRWWLQDRGGGGNLDALESLLGEYAGKAALRIPLRPEFVPGHLEALLDGPDVPPIDPDSQELLFQHIHPAVGGHAKTLRESCIGRIAVSVGDFREDRNLPAFLENVQRTIGKGETLRRPVAWLRSILEPMGPLPEPTRAWRTFVTALDPLLLPPEVALIQTLVPRLVADVRREKRVRGQLDFDDLIGLVWEALERSDPGTARDLAASLRHRYRFALVDEFQDTDELQWAIVRRVFLESPGPHRVYLIGDPKQSIYAFRHADVETYIRARREIAGRPDASLVTLTENFRSTPAMVTFFERFFRDEPAGFFTGPIRQTVPVRPGLKDLQVRDGSGRAPPAVTLFQVRPGERDLDGRSWYRATGVAIASEVRALLEDPARALRLVRGSEDIPVGASDIFVLCRTNSECARILRRLREAGVPASIYKQDGLFRTDEAREILAVLRAVAEPDRPARRRMAWNTPFFAVPLDRLADIEDVPHDHPLVTRLRDWHELARERRFETLFSRLLDESGLAGREILLDDSERALTNYQHVLEILLEETVGEGLDVHEIVRRLGHYVSGELKPGTEDGDLQRIESERQAVQVMSIHRSKGLEASVVFLFVGPASGDARISKVGPMILHDDHGERVCSIGCPDDRRDLALDEHRHEEERLYYVALTRARARLYLPHAPATALAMKGSYRSVRDRIEALRPWNDLQHDGRPLVEVRDVEATLRPPRVDPPDQPGTGWDPPPPDDAPVRESLAGLRAARRPREVTSYTRLKRHARYESPMEAVEFVQDAPDPGLFEGPDLPGGVASGIFLHAMIEDLPFETLALHDDFEAWAADPAVLELFDRGMGRSGIEPRYRERSQWLIYRTLSRPLEIPGTPLPPLGSIRRHRRELEFLYPIPEGSHPPLSAPVPGKLAVERGYITGFIDFVFDHEGRVYFADWKGDRLPGWEPGALEAHVSRNYTLQAELYTLAMIKMLGIRDAADHDARFGGLLYVFLRGLADAPPRSSRGVYFRRPGWDEVQTFPDVISREVGW